jgi:hypothetical protein
VAIPLVSHTCFCAVLSRLELSSQHVLVRGVALRSNAVFAADSRGTPHPLLMCSSCFADSALSLLLQSDLPKNARRCCHKPRRWCARRWWCRRRRRRRGWRLRDGGVRSGGGLVPAAHRGDCAVSGGPRGPRWVLLRVLHRLLRSGAGRRGLRRRGLLLLLRHARLRRGRAGGAGLPGLLRRVLRGLR